MKVTSIFCFRSVSGFVSSLVLLLGSFVFSLTLHASQDSDSGLIQEPVSEETVVRLMSALNELSALQSDGDRAQELEVLRDGRNREGGKYGIFHLDEKTRGLLLNLIETLEEGGVARDSGLKNESSRSTDPEGVEPTGSLTF